MAAPSVEFNPGSSPPFALGVYSFVVTAVTAAGETAAINYATIKLTATGRTSCVVSWNAYAGALSYKVYASRPNQPLGYLGTASPGDLFLVKTQDVFTVDTNLPPSATTSIALLPVSSQLPAFSYSYAVTGLTPLGETAATYYSSVVVTTSNSTVVHLTWLPMPSATSYRVYGRSGPEYGLLTTTQALTYDDWGQTTPDVNFHPPVASTYPAAYLTLSGITANSLYSTRG
jgi:hypothetical protein